MYRLFSTMLTILILSILSLHAKAEVTPWFKKLDQTTQCQQDANYQMNSEGKCILVESSKTLAKDKYKLTAVSEPSCVVVKGQASMDGVNEAFAKKMAIRDALKNATMQRDVKVNSDITMQNHQLTMENSRFVSQSHVKNYTLLREGLEDSEDIYGQPKTQPLNYEVELEVCLTAERGICPDLNGRKYYPNLLIAPLAVADIAGARDIRNLVSGYQSELDRRLIQQGQKNVTKLNQVIDLQPNQSIEPNLHPQLLNDLYNQTGAQYVLLSVLRSIAAQTEDRSYWRQIKEHYDQALEADSRYLEVDWYLVSLLNHSIVFQDRANIKVKGSVRVGRDRSFGSNAFFATKTGKGFHQILNREVDDVMNFMHCQSFESEVVDVRDGKYYLYLNSESGVQVGDDLAVTHRIGSGVSFAGNMLGSEYQPGAFLKVTAIHPKFVVAELISQKTLVQIGDRVRPW